MNHISQPSSFMSRNGQECLFVICRPLYLLIVSDKADKVLFFILLFGMIETWVSWDRLKIGLRENPQETIVLTFLNLFFTQKKTGLL